MNVRAVPGADVAARQSSPAGAPGAERSVWADAAKGLCILLVVLWHVVWKHYLHVDWRLPAAVPDAWSVFVRMLLPMRMPLFFTISGMFAVSAVDRPWRVVARSRVARFGYLYVVWFVIHTAVLAPLPIAFDTEIARDGWDLLEQLTVTPMTLWYLLALALYFVVAKVLRRVPAAVVLAAAFALSVVSAAGWLDSPGNRAGLYQNLVFFLAGLYLSGPIRSMAARTSWRLVAVSGLAFAVVLGVLGAFDAKDVPGVWPVAGVVATVFGVLAMAWVSRWRPLGRLASGLGRRTLPIYIVHLPVLAVLHWLVAGPMAAAPAGVRWVLLAVEPVVVAVLLVGFSLGLHAVLLRVGAWWLFDLPGRRERPVAAMVATAPDWPSVDDTVRFPAVVPVPRMRADDTLTVPLPRVRRVPDQPRPPGPECSAWFTLPAPPVRPGRR